MGRWDDGTMGRWTVYGNDKTMPKKMAAKGFTCSTADKHQHSQVIVTFIYYHLFFPQKFGYKVGL